MHNFGNRYWLTWKSAFLLIVGLVASSIESEVWAVQQEDGNNSQVEELQRLYSDRRVSQLVRELAEAIREENITVFREKLEALRESDPLLMVRSSGDIYRPLHRELSLQLLVLPDSLIEVMNQTAARTRPLDAMKEGDLDTVGPELVRALHRSSGTDDSLKIHMLLAVIHRDYGQFDAATYWLEPVLRNRRHNDLRESARALVRAMSDGAEPDASSDQESTGESDSIAPDDGKGVDDPKSPDESLRPSKTNTTERNIELGALLRKMLLDESESSDDALMNSEEEVTSSGPRLQRHAQWIQTLPLSVRDKRASQEYVRNAPAGSYVPWSAGMPFVDAEHVCVRVDDAVSVFDRRTGRHLWTRKPGPGNRVMDPIDLESPFPPGFLPMMGRTTPAGSAEAIGLVRNEITSQITADRERLYVVVPIGISSSAMQDRMMQFRGFGARNAQLTRPVSELIAFDKSTGRRVWTVGGPEVEARFGNELSLAWISGSPVVSTSYLYCLVEQDSAIQVAALESATGALRWKIPVAYPDADLSIDIARQRLSAHGCLHEGLLLTTTATGWFVAVDTLTRSVIWAVSLPRQEDEMFGRLRGRFDAAIREPAPMEKVIRSETPLVVGNSVVCIDSGSDQLTLIDLRSGRCISRTGANECTLVVGINPDIIVMAGNKRLTALRASDLRELWDVERTGSMSAPVGCGHMTSTEIEIPLADGSIEIRRLRDGALRDLLPGQRPSNSTGGLLASNGDVISYGLDHVAVFSEKPPTGDTATDAVHLSAFYLASGRFTEAHETLSSVQPNAINAGQIRKLTFRIAAAQIAVSEISDQARLEELVQIASGDEEKAVAFFMKCLHYQRREPAEYIQLICSLLKEDATSLHVEIPDPPVLLQTLQASSLENPLEINPSATGEQALRRPFGAWLAQELARVLDSSDSSLMPSVATELNSLPGRWLLSVHSAQMVPAWLDRVDTEIGAGKATEEVMQMLLAASDFRDQLPADKQPNVQRRIETALISLREVIAKNAELPETTRKAALFLVEVLNGELKPAAPGDEANSAVVTDDERIPFHRLRRDVAQREYRMVPVAASGQMSMRTDVATDVWIANDSDPFLTTWSWTARSQPGALTAHPAAGSENESWAWRMADYESTVTARNERILRQGSVVLYFSHSGISAFSVLDGRWLWTHAAAAPFDDELSRDRTFTDYPSGLPYWPEFQTERRLCGGTRRWICLQRGPWIEVVDVYTGQRRWGMNYGGIMPIAFATESMISIQDKSNEIMYVRLDANSGKELPGTVEPNTLSSEERIREHVLSLRKITIASGDRHLVNWIEPESGDDTPSLVWSDARTSNTIRSLKLPENTVFQFLGQDTVVGMSRNYDVSVWDLNDGSHRQLAVSERAAELNGVQPARWLFDEDLENYYLYSRVDNHAAIMAMGSFPGLKSQPVRDRLQAYDKQTGRFLWSLPIDGVAHAVFADIQQPVLLLMSEVENKDANAANPGIAGLFRSSSGYRVQGISRATGQVLFTYPVVAQVPYPGVRLRIRSADQIDLEAFGNRVRFFADETVRATVP